MEDDRAVGVNDGLSSCPWPVRMYRVDSGERITMPCRRRRCAYCGPKHWRPKVLAGLHAGLKAADPQEYLALLLTAPGDSRADDFNADAARRWNVFMLYLRRAFPGAELNFWKVAELQVRGHVHYHVVLRGLRWLPVEKLREVAVAAGFGEWVGLRQPRRYPGGVQSIGYYFGKYLLKDYDRDLSGTRLVTQSAGWRVGWVAKWPRWPRGTFFYAGPVNGGWRFIGQEVAQPRRTPAEPEPPPWWGDRSWQAARAAWAPSRPLWEEKGGRPNRGSGPAILTAGRGVNA